MCNSRQKLYKEWFYCKLKVNQLGLSSLYVLKRLFYLLLKVYFKVMVNWQSELTHGFDAYQTLQHMLMGCLPHLKPSSLPNSNKGEYLQTPSVSKELLQSLAAFHFTGGNCGVPTSPVNGTVSMEDALGFGNAVLYECNEGHVLEGKAEVLCTPSGWSASPPICRGIIIHSQ